MRKTLTVVALMTLLLTACGPEVDIEDASSPTAGGGADGATSTPGGRIEDLPEATSEPTSSERGVSGRAKVEVPEGWTESRVDDVFDLRYLAGEAETDPLLSIAGDFGQFHGARAAVSTLIAQIQMGTPGFTIHSQEDVDVPGASSGVRVDFSWGTEEDGGVFDGMWLVAVDSSNGDTVAVAYSGGQDEVDEDDLDDVADSFTMLPAGG